MEHCEVIIGQEHVEFSYMRALFCPRPVEYKVISNNQRTDITREITLCKFHADHWGHVWPISEEPNADT